MRGRPYPSRGIDTLAAQSNSKSRSVTMTKATLTYRDYEALPDDGRRYEIHDGELSVTRAPSPQHQIVSINLVRGLALHIPAVVPGLLLYAPLDVLLTDTTIVQPDVGYRYVLAIGATGPDPVALPPFAALRLVPDTLWP
jgi:hypothetical protein